MKNLTDVNKRIELLKDVEKIMNKITGYYCRGLVDRQKNVEIAGNICTINYSNVIEFTNWHKRVIVDYDDACRLHSLNVYIVDDTNKWYLAGWADLNVYNKTQLICRVALLIERAFCDGEV